ncbi:MAG: hypothetical protein ACK4S4_05725 [Pyrinomonadaceae bacterium]
MNVFEDLIVELKEQNLLEETVLDLNEVPLLRAEFELVDDEIERGDGPYPAAAGNGFASDHSAFQAPPKADAMKKRVSEQMAALQMVDHVLMAVERGFLELEPEIFDDLPAKKALHKYSQAARDPESNEYFEAESKLLLEIEAWMLALNARDREVPVAALRRYCETTHPPLSPQALFALARFYRGSEPVEQTIRKFDFIVSRLFSKNGEDGMRAMICSREDAIGHLKKRYADWAVVPSSPASDNGSEAALAVLAFDDIAAEAASASTLDDLVGADLFERLLRAKVELGETYFSPSVVAAAIECNIAVANRLTEMLTAESAALGGPEAVVKKYSGIDQMLISDAVGRTFSLQAALNCDAVAETFNIVDDAVRPAADGGNLRSHSRPRPFRPHSNSRQARTKIFGISRWLFVVCLIAVIASASIYVWGEYFAGSEVETASVRSIDLGDPSISEHVKSTKLSGDILYGVVAPSFEALPRDRREAFLRRLQAMGADKGYTRVSLSNLEGRTIAFASRERIQLTEDLMLP